MAFCEHWRGNSQMIPEVEDMIANTIIDVMKLTEARRVKKPRHRIKPGVN